MKTHQRDMRGEDAGAPTPERARIANGSLHTFPIYENPNSRVPIATGRRVVPVLEKLRENGQITEAMYQAGVKFRENYTYGMLSRVTGRYGLDFEMAAAIGPTSATPIGQLTEDALSRLPDRTKYVNDFHAGYKYINHKETADACVAIICEESATLSEVGYSWTEYGSAKQQSAAGFAQFKIGLDMLSVCYGTKKNRK